MDDAEGIVDSSPDIIVLGNHSNKSDTFLGSPVVCSFTSISAIYRLKETENRRHRYSISRVPVLTSRKRIWCTFAVRLKFPYRVSVALRGLALQD